MYTDKLKKLLSNIILNFNMLIPKTLNNIFKVYKNKNLNMTHIQMIRKSIFKLLFRRSVKKI